MNDTEGAFLADICGPANLAAAAHVVYNMTAGCVSEPDPCPACREPRCQQPDDTGP